jgi:hypothetical protein
MIGIPIGLLAANATEWVFHKHVLHGLGKRKRSFWSFHWHEHHRNANRNAFRDPAYERSVFRWNGQGKEALALSLGALGVAPLFPLAPAFTATLWYSAWNYYRKHKRSHRDPEWAREHLPWHYDHHMAPDQDANWCVTRPWFDLIMGTRVRYLGSERAAELRQRSQAQPAPAAG